MKYIPAITTACVLLCLVTPPAFTEDAGGERPKSNASLSEVYDVIRAADAEALEELLDSGMDPSTTIKGRHLLDMALSAPNFWLTRDPIDTVSLEAKILRMVQALISRGAIVKPYRSMLFWPASQGYPNVVDYLIKHGVNPTLPGSTAKKGRYYPPPDFYSYGTKFGMEDVDCGPPLLWAYRGGHDDVALVLLKHGVTPYTHKEIRNIQFVAAAQDGDLASVKHYLTVDKVYRDATDPNGNTALGASIEMRQYRVILFLLDYGVDPNQRIKNVASDTYTTALHEAAVMILIDEKSHLELVAKLLDCGAHVSEIDYLGRTPLHIAVSKYGKVKVAELLIEAGAKIMPKDNDGKTPLDSAITGPMIKLLKKHGAKESGM